MTNRIALFLAVGLLALRADAATTVTQPLQVHASVPERCRVSPPTGTTSPNATFTPGANGGALRLTGLVDPVTALTRATQGTILFPVVCTGTYSLTVTSQGGLVNETTTTASNGFATRLNYVLSASWGSAAQSVETSGTPVSLDLSAGGAQLGNLTIGFNVPAGRGPLVAGTYTDEIIIQLNAQ